MRGYNCLVCFLAIYCFGGRFDLRNSGSADFVNIDQVGSGVF
jgi:hypothetical protein